MEMNTLSQNVATLNLELAWFERVADLALRLYLGQEEEAGHVSDISPPDLSEDPSPYAEMVRGLEMGFPERVVLCLALIPHVRPNLLDIFFTKNAQYDRGFTEFGGIRGQNHGGFLPTGETAAFLLASNNLADRYYVEQLFDPDHYFKRYGILELETSKNEPLLSGPLLLSNEYRTYLTSGRAYYPPYSAEFPAKRLTTDLTWEDLVLEEHIREEVEEIHTWIQHRNTLLQEWELSRLLSPGFKCLFYGPSGTGKTLTASLLGKSTGFDVYRVDLSMIISKYIGETEKNLAKVFDQAEQRNWILFFDEADALFGKRSQTKGAHDRYANQEVSYLLQRMEDYPGVVILATNLERNIDDAFLRRFHSLIHFTAPPYEQRKLLWEKMFTRHLTSDHVSKLGEWARKYELAGGSLLNVLRYSSIQAVRNGHEHIQQQDIVAGVHREYRKQGKTVE